MNNLTKEKKQQLALVAIFTLVILIGVWFGLVDAQQKRRIQTEKKTAEMQKQIVEAEKLLKRKDEIKEAMEKNEQELVQREQTLPPPTPVAYQWLIEKVNDYTKPHPSLTGFFTQQPAPVDAGIIPKFPYKALYYNQVTMSGFFNEFGKFLADFENDWPYLRVQNLSMVPASALPGDEKINFQFEIVSLTATNQSTLSR